MYHECSKLSGWADFFFFWLGPLIFNGQIAIHVIEEVRVVNGEDSALGFRTLSNHVLNMDKFDGENVRYGDDGDQIWKW